MIAYKNIVFDGPDTPENRLTLVTNILRTPENPNPSQAEIDAELILLEQAIYMQTTKAESRQFLQDNPQARQLIELPAGDLLTAIENRTAGQETLLLKTLAMAVRYLYAAGLND